MLDSDLHEPRVPLAQLIEGLPCEIELPASLAGHLKEATSHTYVPEDKRRFVRQGFLSLAGLEYRQTAPVLLRRRAWHKVYTINISCSGLAFVHSEQLFPLERMGMWIPSEKLPSCFGSRTELDVEVARCRRINDRCFEIGAHFVDDAS